MKKQPAALNTKATSTKKLNKPTSPPTKLELCSYELLKAGTNGIHKLGTPTKVYGETALPSTISNLVRRIGLTLSKKRTKHTHRAGGLTFFTWYWLPDRKEAEKALAFVNEKRSLRAASLITEKESQYLLDQFPNPHP
ncbi:hypothetical protein ACMXYR_14920 [Neptuniibacter sp. QD29_5]|uniref:hypothetical protein n=1 Tax=Neptuniibacter sp. QD29_5 TaxID=3398207 RepID=UPI0039F4A3CC